MCLNVGSLGLVEVGAEVGFAAAEKGGVAEDGGDGGGGGGDGD